METSIANNQFIIPMKLKKLFVSIDMMGTWLNKEKLAKNTSIYKNLIVFIMAFVSLKKMENTLKSSSIFILIIMAHIAQNSSKKTYKETFELWLLTQNKYKKANFINNQLECVFFVFFNSKAKYIYNLP